MRSLTLLALLLGTFGVLHAQQPAPGVEWQRCLGGTLNDRINALIRTADNGFLLVGNSFSNDGTISGHHNSTDSSDAWVAKLSSTGDLQWQRSYGGTGDDDFISIIATTDGNYICLGETNSGDGDVVGAHGAADIWVVKIDPAGNIIWQRSMGGSREEKPGNIRLFSDGRVAVIGTTNSNDGHVSGLHGTQFRKDIWVAWLNQSGDLTSQRCFGGSMEDEGHDIIESDNDHFIISGTVPSDDGDFGQHVGNAPSGIIVKINDANTMVWKYGQGRTHNTYLQRKGTEVYITYSFLFCYPGNASYAVMNARFTDAPSLTSPPNVTYINTWGYCPSNTSPSVLGYLVNGPQSSAFVNPLQNVTVVSSDNPGANPGSHGLIDGFLMSYTSGNIGNWSKYVGGSGKDYLTSVIALSETEFLAVGYTNSNDGDVSGNHGANDGWIVKLSKTNLIKGTVFADYNSNGLKDAGEPFVNNKLVVSTKAGSQSAGSTYNGAFANLADTGIYTTTVTPDPYFTIVPASKVSNFSTYGNKDSIGFSMRPLPGKKDFGVSVFAVTPARPGFPVNYALQYGNVGTEAMSRPVKFIKDRRLTVHSIVPAPDQVSGDTLIWNVAGLLPKQSAYISMSFLLAAPPAAVNGDTLVSTAMIDTAGDISPTDNNFVLRQIVTGSYDPNDKQEMHGRFLYKVEYDAGTSLLYTIRFQNTGTDTAFNIVVEDTLSSLLDANTIEMISASHPYTLSITNGKYCNWSFNNIRLPDSNVNEPASHGYISFRIKPVSGMALNDVVTNKAAIYFDFNEAVITNTSTTTIVPTPVLPPAQPLIAGLQNAWCSNEGTKKIRILNLPAAATTITVAVKLDGASLPVAADSTVAIALAGLNAGQHTLEIVYSNMAGSATSSFAFTITAAVMPDVNVTASLTQVANTTTPIIIKAVNAAGGGKDPLYTFAWDRNFTNIIQAESAKDSVTLQSGALALGDNRIYVRMKSNANCVVTPGNTDSTSIRRDQATGIVDIDNPGQIINVYPNPFRTLPVITGLSSSKQYIVSVSDFAGRQLYQKKISHRTSMELPAIQGAAGLYHVTVYDALRMRRIGTIQIIKQ